MNATMTPTRPGGRALTLCLAAGLLATAATTVRAAPRSEMVVPGYKACSARAEPQGMAGTGRAAPATAAPGSQQVAEAPVRRCPTRPAG